VVRSDELEVTRALFELAQAGYISIDPPRTQGPRAIVEVFNQAMSIVMRELDAVGAGQTIRQQLAAFAAGGGAYAVLFAGAGPAPDGTLNAVRIEQNFKRLASQNDSPRLLSEWLHDYASYALFLARPHLERAESGKVDSPERRLSHRLRLVLAPIAPLKRK
jgi:hypothetical protein